MALPPPTKTHLIVLGGSGYLGSSILRAAITRPSFTTITSISRSGLPSLTPGGHKRAWTEKVNWVKGSAFNPESYRELLRSKNDKERIAVVCAIGTLLPDPARYKKAVKEGSIFGLAGAWLGAMTGSGGEGGGETNPLMRGMSNNGEDPSVEKSGYDYLNRQSAVTVLDTLLSTIPTASMETMISPDSLSSTPSSSSSLSSSSSSQQPSPSLPAPAPAPTTPFIYISAEDTFRPFIPPGYILSKRKAEKDIWRRVWEWGKMNGVGMGAQNGGEEEGIQDGGGVRPVFMRPGLMYHPHNRPLSTLPATILDVTSRLPLPGPTSSPTSPLTPLSSIISLGQTLSIPPIHVDHVGECVIRAIENEEVVGVVGTREMRRWVGLEEKLGGEPLGMMERRELMQGEKEKVKEYGLS